MIERLEFRGGIWAVVDQTAGTGALWAPIEQEEASKRGPIRPLSDAEVAALRTAPAGSPEPSYADRCWRSALNALGLLGWVITEDIYDGSSTRMAHRLERAG